MSGITAALEWGNGLEGNNEVGVGCRAAGCEGDGPGGGIGGGGPLAKAMKCEYLTWGTSVHGCGHYIYL